MTRTRMLVAAAVAATLVVPTGAAAHVTVQPTTAEAGSYTVQNVRVPNESETESVRELRLQMPAGFETVRTAPIPGWDADITRDGDAVTEVTWTAEDEESRVAPGEFLDFPISVQIPEGSDELVYKAIETYDGTKVSRWIGAPDSDNPAPIVAVTPASGDGHGGGTAGTAEVVDPAPAAAVTTVDEGSDTLSIVALIVGALGLLAGGAALVTSRRRTA